MIKSNWNILLWLGIIHPSLPISYWMQAARTKMLLDNQMNVSVIHLSLLHEMQSEDTQVKISGVGGRQPIVKLTGYGIHRRFLCTYSWTHCCQSSKPCWCRRALSRLLHMYLKNHLYCTMQWKALCYWCCLIERGIYHCVRDWRTHFKG